MILTLATVFTLAWSKTISPVLIKAPQADPQEFMIHSQIEGVEKVSTWQSQCSQSQELQEGLKNAQFQFLSGSLEKSKVLFQKITDLQWACDWSPDERQAIHYSLMRLAQMAASESEQIQRLTQAVGFDEDIIPDSQLIPPPIMILFKKIQQQITKKQIPVPTFAKKFDLVLKNGKALNIQSGFIQTVPLRARYTFISESYKNEVQTLSLEELESLNIEPTPWVVGDCKTHSLQEVAHKITQPFKVYFDKNCIVDFNKTPIATENFSQKILQQHSESFANTTSTPYKKNWIQRNYLWVGATVLASAALIIKMNQKEERTVPSATFTPDPQTAGAQ